MHRESSTSLVLMCPPISIAYVGGIMQLVVHILSMDEILMGYWVTGQIRTMTSSVMYKSKFRMGDMILRRVLDNTSKTARRH